MRQKHHMGVQGEKKIVMVLNPNYCPGGRLQGYGVRMTRIGIDLIEAVFPSCFGHKFSIFFFLSVSSRRETEPSECSREE